MSLVQELNKEAKKVSEEKEKRKLTNAKEQLINLAKVASGNGLFSTQESLLKLNITLDEAKKIVLSFKDDGFNSTIIEEIECNGELVPGTIPYIYISWQ